MCRKQTGAKVGNRQAHPHGPLARLTRDRHQPTHALRDLVKSGPIGQRPGLAKTGNAGKNQPRMRFAQGFVINTQPVFDIRTEILNHHISTLNQTLQGGNTIRCLEIQRHRPLVPVGVLIVGTILTAQRIVTAHVLRHLHLNDIGTPIGQLATGSRPGTNLGQINDPETLKCR